MGRLLTQVVVVVGLALFGVYDAYIISSQGYEASISTVILEWSHKAPIIPFVAGILAGHLFWPQTIQENS